MNVLTLDTPMLVVIFLFGLVFGSFGNVLISRVPDRESIRGRSRCPRCGHQLKAWELVPVISFIVLHWRCSQCRKPISFQYPLVELATGILFVVAFLSVGTISITSVLLALCFWLLLLITVCDMKTQLIPDAFNLPFIVCAVAYGLLTHPFSVSALLIASGFFILQWVISRGTWIGTGDLLLTFGIAWLLPSALHAFLFLLIGYVSGASVAAVFLLRKKTNMNAHFAFGPFLALSAVIVVMWADQLLALSGL